MSDPYAAALSGAAGRSYQLDQVLGTLLRQAPDVEAAAVVSFDGLPMASALPAGMDEDRVAAMSAALLSLGERAAQGLGRGDLSQVYVEGDNGTVFLVSADDEAVLVAVGRAGAKVGLMLFEVKQAAAPSAPPCGSRQSRCPRSCTLRPQPVRSQSPRSSRCSRSRQPAADPAGPAGADQPVHQAGPGAGPACAAAAGAVQDEPQQVPGTAAPHRQP